MKVIDPSVELINPIPYHLALGTIELSGRTCYQSEDKMTEGSAEDFIRRIIKLGHESVLEHVSVTARFICDRGVSHEIVRHRIGAYSQESTRYCNYSGDKFGNEITVIRPCFWDAPSEELAHWWGACKTAENKYFILLKKGATPQEARSVLPNSLKTTIVVTYDIREWRHFFRLRCAPEAHPQMRQVANMALELMANRYPVFFGDLAEGALGKWIDKGKAGDPSWEIDGRGNCWTVYECSECGYRLCGAPKTPYCPHCGAKMDLKG